MDQIQSSFTKCPTSLNHLTHCGVSYVVTAQAFLSPLTQFQQSQVFPFSKHSETAWMHLILLL